MGFSKLVFNINSPFFRFAAQVKLLRIVVKDGKCGFNTDSLTHDSVVRLIEFHRNISLNIFNDALDVRLLYPVSVRRNSQNGKPFFKKGQLQQRMILSAKNDHGKLFYNANAKFKNTVISNFNCCGISLVVSRPRTIFLSRKWQNFASE